MKIMTSFLLSIILFVFCINNTKEATEHETPHHCDTVTQSKVQNIIIENTDSLTIYFPQYNKIDLVCQTMPAPDEENVLMCCAAAFTGKCLDTFKHNNIAGNHVANGTYYKGYSCKANTGCFAYYPDIKSWEFAYDDYAHCLDKAVAHNGMAFGQAMIINNGADVHKGPCNDKSKNQYRALCELNGKLCIIDASFAMPYIDFVQSLVSLGVKYAVYLDMGTGWNYSFYRDNEGNITFIHNQKGRYNTNWITFYK